MARVLAAESSSLSFAADGDPPVADLDREHHVGGQRSQGDQDEGAVVAHEQNAQHQGDFDQGRQDRVKGVADQARHRAAAALDVAGHAAGLTFEVKAQRKRVQMPEHLQGDAAHGSLGHAGKKDFAQLGEQRGGKAQARHTAGATERAGRAPVACAQAVDHLLEDQRHGDVGEFRGEQTRQCQADAPLVLPQVRQQLVQGSPEMAFGTLRSVGDREGRGGAAHGSGFVDRVADCRSMPCCRGRPQGQRRMMQKSLAFAAPRS